MPHLILQHNVEDEEIVKYVCKKLHGCLAQQDTIKLGSIKTRSVFVSSVVIGDGLDKGVFAHLDLKLLPGRSDELKQAISLSLLEALKVSLKTGALSVEINELQSYSKANV